jgi:hypothetical protein
MRDRSHCQTDRSIERGGEANITAIHCRQGIEAFRLLIALDDLKLPSSPCSSHHLANFSPL